MREQPIIAPSILSADFTRLGEEIREIETAGADWVHIDVMDGHFVPNLTFGPPVVAALRPLTKLPFDVHLMIEQPERYLPAFAEAGADIVTVHAEACVHLHRTLQQIRGFNLSAGVALNPATPLAFVEHVLQDVDLVLIMTVNPGFGGQAYIPEMGAKVARLRQMLDERGLNHVRIEVDGGIQPDTAASAHAAGADVLVAGSSIFGEADRAQAIKRLRQALAGG